MIDEFFYNLAIYRVPCLKWKFLQIARVLAKADTLVIIMSALAKSRDSKGN